MQASRGRDVHALMGVGRCKIGGTDPQVRTVRAKAKEAREKMQEAKGARIRAKGRARDEKARTFPSRRPRATRKVRRLARARR